MTRTRLTLAAAAVAALLAACGGGGGGDSTTPPPTGGGGGTVTPPPGGGGTVTPPPDPYALQTEVPAPTYAAGSWQEFAFNYLNERRKQCGFGLLAQAPELDKSAQAHADYLVQLEKDLGNDAYKTDMHSEDPARPLFTGARPSDRAKAAGYTGSAGEQLSGVGIAQARPDMASLLMVTHDNVQGLLVGPYHLNWMISLSRDVGFGLSTWTFRDEVNNGFSSGFFAINVGQKNSPQAHPTQTLSYPCEGTTDVSESLGGERPNPTNGHAPVQFPVGPAIMLMSPPNTTLKVQTASVTPISRLNGQPLGDLPAFNYASTFPSGILILTTENDTNKVLYEKEKVFMMPHKPLAMGVTYRVEVAYTVSGQAQTKAFQFSTRTKLPTD